MKLEGYYSSGQFAKKAHVSIRTVRFYDKQNILHPSFVNENGARFYTDEDFARLQQILLLKYLGFSLDDIRAMTIGDEDYHLMLSSLQLQKRLVQDKIEQMQLVEQAIDNSIQSIQKNNALDGDQILELIHLTGMENSMKAQYKNASNISARISLHKDYSTNKEGWFPWLFRQLNLKDGMKVLEIGCGNGALWLENRRMIPADIDITLSDISEGMVRDVKRSMGKDKRFTYMTFDCLEIPFEKESVDLVIANHLLFYCDNIDKVLKEIKRVLKKGGLLICSTYGPMHMREITDLVQKFDERIRLSSENLYDRFGLHNGEAMLKKYFKKIDTVNYEDEIVINISEPIIEYILSCHGNQNQYLVNNYHEFKQFVDKEVQKDFHITKDAGIFLCKK